MHPLYNIHQQQLPRGIADVSSLATSQSDVDIQLRGWNKWLHLPRNLFRHDFFFSMKLSDPRAYNFPSRTNVQWDDIQDTSLNYSIDEWEFLISNNI